MYPSGVYGDYAPFSGRKIYQHRGCKDIFEKDFLSFVYFCTVTFPHFY